MIRPVFLFPLILAAVCCLFFGCEKQKKESNLDDGFNQPITRSRFVRPKPVSQGFVGSEACRACHEEINELYSQHPMGKSMARTSEYRIEDYQSKQTVADSDRKEWRAELVGDQVFHVETVKNSDGTPLVTHREKMDYTCGSGTRGCSYFFFRDGKLFQSPLTWYSKSRKWDLSPGYEPLAHPRFERMASDGCLVCHAGRMNPIKNERSTFQIKKPFHEMAIGCERCHGPGKDHIEFHENGDRPADAVDPIVNPESLEPELRDAVCYQCHLQGENRVPRYGRSEYDFRPGMHISDVWITFLKTGETTGGKTQAVSQVEQMQQSECFIGSKGKLGCISCHDAHTVPDPEHRIEFYRSRCIQCHDGQSVADGIVRTKCSSPVDVRKQSSPEDSCIQCHMPSLNAGDVPHTAQTDHRVHIPGDKYDYQFETDDGFLIWNDRNVPRHSVERAKTIAQSEQAFLRSDSKLADKAMKGLASFHPIPKDDLALNEAMAQLFFAKGDSVEGSRIWSALINKYPRDEFLLTGFSLALHQEGKYAEAYPYYRKLASINNNRPLVLLRYLDVCTRLNKLQEGLQVANRILELDPGSRITHEWLSRAYETRGDADKATYHREMAASLPDLK